MKIKKPTETASGAPASGGAAIADRFKLENIEAAPKGGTVSKRAATIALIAGVVALVIAGLLTLTLFKHWQFLKLA